MYLTKIRAKVYINQVLEQEKNKLRYLLRLMLKHYFVFQAYYI